MIEDWKSSLDNGNNVGTIAVDLSKAFDSLPHGLLLMAKLFAYGVTLPACKLLCSYLHYRHQRVKISDAKSNWLNIEKGVPQGSILGPLLFNIFINDKVFIDNDVTMYNYADDNCTAYTHKDIETIKSVLECDIKKMLDWFKVLLQWNSTSVYTSCTYSTYHLELALGTFICHFISACLVCHTS